MNKIEAIRHMIQDMDGAYETYQVLSASLNPQLAKILRHWRADNRMSLRQLGKEWGYSAMYLSDIENGRRNVSKEMREKILNLESSTQDTNTP